MKLAGLLTESQINEMGESLNTRELNGIIRYFQRVQKKLGAMCDDVLNSIKFAQSNKTDEEALYGVVEMFERHGLKVLDIDGSFEDFYDAWVDTRLDFDKPNKFAKNLPKFKDYFTRLKKQNDVVCGGLIKMLESLKVKGKNATESDISKVEYFFKTKGKEFVTLDKKAFQRWYNWCTEEILPELYTNGKQTDSNLSTPMVPKSSSSIVNFEKDPVKFKKGYSGQNFNWRDSTFMGKKDAIHIMKQALPGGYNEFKAELIDKLPSDAKIQIAREYSVCLYVKTSTKPDKRSLKAAELDMVEKNIYRIWWD